MSQKRDNNVTPRAKQRLGLSETEHLGKGMSRKEDQNGKVRPKGWALHDRASFHPFKSTRKSRRVKAEQLDPPYRSSPRGILVSVPANEHGHTDGDHVAALDRRTRPLADPLRREDVLLDISAVRSVSSEFMKLFEALRQNLASQDRDVYLYDMKHASFGIVRASEVRKLVSCRDADGDNGSGQKAGLPWPIGGPGAGNGRRTGSVTTSNDANP